MNRTMPVIIGFSLSCLLVGQSFAYNYWSNDVGGDFNVPPKEYNYEYHGYGSTGRTIYNKIDLHNGQAMQITGGNLYDNQGNIIGIAKPNMIGYYNGVRNGGIIAGAITQLRINGKKKRVIYAWSVNIEGGGRKSGWVLAKNFSPKSEITNILKQNKKDRLALIKDKLQEADYERMIVKAAYLPSKAAEWYLMAGRDSNAGKAKYYFTRDGLISGIKNIPETGHQRYGVAHDSAPIGAYFYKDKNIDEVKIDIYKPNGSSPTDYSLKLVWGYFVNNAGKKWHSWINSAALR